MKLVAVFFIRLQLMVFNYQIGIEWYAGVLRHFWIKEVMFHVFWVMMLN